MEAKELRIGNFVMSKINGISRVEQIGSSLNSEYVGGRSLDGNYWENSYLPIPLTEQVLVDCGFEKLKSDYEEAETWDFYYGILYFDMANNSVKINSQYCLSNIPEYLHQLQNLYFALTGQELEYKPKK